MTYLRTVKLIDVRGVELTYLRTVKLTDVRGVELTYLRTVKLTDVRRVELSYKMYLRTVKLTFSIDSVTDLSATIQSTFMRIWRLYGKEKLIYGSDFFVRTLYLPYIRTVE